MLRRRSGSAEKPFRIVVIGGGIIGSTTALYLARNKNTRVTLLEKHEQLGQETSFANAGILRLSSWSSMATPGNLLQGMRGLLRTDGLPYFRIDARSLLASASSWAFFPRFLWYSLAFPRARARRELFLRDFSAFSISELRALCASEPALAAGAALSFGGGLSLLPGAIPREGSEPSKRALEEDSQGEENSEIALQAAGYAAEPARALARRLPLARAHSADGRGDCLGFLQALPPVLREHGIDVRLGSEVIGIASTSSSSSSSSSFSSSSSSSIVRLRSGESLDADAVVVCTARGGVGALPPPCPMAGVRGYSLDVRRRDGRSFAAPSAAAAAAPYLLDERDHVVVVPMRDARVLRFVGFAELVGKEGEREMAGECVDALRSYARDAIAPLEGEEVALWMGARPLTPDGLPLIGEDRRAGAPPGVVWNAGHAAMGWKTACASALAVQKILFDDVELPFDLDFVRPDRFDFF